MTSIVFELLLQKKSALGSRFSQLEGDSSQETEKMPILFVFSLICRDHNLELINHSTSNQIFDNRPR